MEKINPNKYRKLSGYDTAAQASIKMGLKTGKVRWEPSRTGGEYIYSADKSFGRKKK